MADPNAASLVKRYVAAFNARDWDALAEILDEDLVHDDFDGERQIGRDAFRRQLAARASERRETLADVAVLAASDSGRAGAEFTLRGQTPDGRSFALAAGEFYDTANGRISRISSFARR